MDMERTRQDTEKRLKGGTVEQEEFKYLNRYFTERGNIWRAVQELDKRGRILKIKSTTRIVSLIVTYEAVFFERIGTEDTNI